MRVMFERNMIDLHHNASEITRAMPASNGGIGPRTPEDIADGGIGWIGKVHG
jgi:hypothetical protein